MNRNRITRTLALGTGVLASGAFLVALAPAANADEAAGNDAASPHADRPYFGARIVATADGATVAHVVDEGPVDNAGIAEGDVVVSIEGVELDERGALREALAGAEPGTELTFVYLHDGEERTATVTLGDPEDRPEPPAAEDVPWVGARLVRVEAGEGVLVRTVLAGSPADEAGLVAGDVVTSIDGDAIEEWWQAREVLREHAPGDTVELTVLRDGDTVSVDLTLGAASDAPARPAGEEGRPEGDRPQGERPEGAGEGRGGEGHGPRGDGAEQDT